jgi:hypothetical protein
VLSETIGPIGETAVAHTVRQRPKKTAKQAHVPSPGILVALHDSYVTGRRQGVVWVRSVALLLQRRAGEQACRFRWYFGVRRCRCGENETVAGARQPFGDQSDTSTCWRQKMWIGCEAVRLPANAK